MFKISKIVPAVIGVAFLFGCAQVRSISGGEKDTSPPEVVSVVPELFTRNFKENGFSIAFNEFVQLNEIQQELLVSPPMKKAPKVKVRQRNVDVIWNDTLAQGTTYIFQFGKSIRDVNESNILEGFTYVFSTGSSLDSMHCEGMIIDALNDRPGAAIKVALFDSLTHVFEADKRPAYVTRSDAAGHFRFDYLRNGTFTLCALSDENNNNRYDIGESIDWKEMVSSAIPSDSALHRLEISTPRDTVFRGFDFSTDSSGVVKCRYDRWLDTVIIRSQSADSVVQWVANDSLYFSPWKACEKAVELYVTCGRSTPDTTESIYLAAEVPSFKLRQTTSSKMRTSDAVLVDGKRPIAAFNDAMLQCYLDSVSISSRSQASNPLRREIIFDRKPGRKYKVRLLPGWITDDCGNTNDTLEFAFTTYDTKELGSLRFKMPECTRKSTCTFQLFDKSKKMVYYSPELVTTEWVLDYLPAGEYTAYVCEDVNRNGRFDPVQIYPKVKTERNHYYQGNIQVRANWEVVVDWPAW